MYADREIYINNLLLIMVARLLRMRILQIEHALSEMNWQWKCLMERVISYGKLFQFRPVYSNQLEKAKALGPHKKYCT